MTRNHRLVLLALAALVLVAAVIALQSGDDEGGERASDTDPAATTTPQPAATAEGGTEEPTATPEPTPEPTPDPGPLLTAAKVTRIEVKKGDRVRFRARSSTPEEVHVHGYDVSKDVEAGQTVTMSFKADIEGIFEIEFEHSAKPIGELRVDPR